MRSRIRVLLVNYAVNGRAVKSVVPPSQMAENSIEGGTYARRLFSCHHRRSTANDARRTRRAESSRVTAG